MTCIFAEKTTSVVQHTNMAIEGPTLPPLPTAEWNLALDELQDLQLQHRVLDLQHPLQDRRALVLNQHPDPMCPMLGELLQYFHEIDG